jgi:S1-C subfamily serine protease
VLDNYRAEGHDIYGHEQIVRQVLEVRAQIFPGSSGGPLVDVDGRLIGMVFGQSQDQSDVGYALTSAAISDVVNTGIGLVHAGVAAVSTGECLTPAG